MTQVSRLTPDDRQLLSEHRRRHLRETLLAYLMIAPAAIITIIFGLYPVALGLWESLKTGRTITNQYAGLDNYTQATGSLVYVLIVFLSCAFFYLAYQLWTQARTIRDDSPGDSIWPLLLPGFWVGLGTIFLSILIVTGGYRMPWFRVADVPVALAWLPVLMVGIGAAGYMAMGRLMRSTNFNRYLTHTGLVMLLTLLGVLLMTYAYHQLVADVQAARSIAMSILNNDVGNAAPLRPVDNAVLANVSLDGSVPIQAEVGGQVVEATLSPTAFDEISVLNLSGQATLALRAGQRVQVQLPLTRGLGLEPAIYETEGVLQVEREAGQIGGGPPTFDLAVQLDDDMQVLVPFDIYETARVGVNVVQRGGYTVPIKDTLYGMLGLLAALGAIFAISHTLGNYDRESASPWQRPDVHRALQVGRVLMALVAVGLVFYTATSVIFYRQTAEAVRSLSRTQLAVAYEYALGQSAPATMTPIGLAAQLMFLPQLTMILTGAILIGAAYLTWQHAARRETALGTLGHVFIAVALMVGGWMFISELPATLAIGGRSTIEVRDALVRTAIYSFGTVPPQLAIGMGLAYLLFYEVRAGKGIFRLIYFMPYITPRVATATIFTVIFSLEATGLANQALGMLGIDRLLWLKEPQGIVQVLYEIVGGNPRHVPSIFKGPSLALTTVIIFNVWVYAGYNAVIFLAGLGAIPGDLYEAARVDGAGRWQAFRHITFPLLSPVTFFLSMLSIIGTFRAFASVYVLDATAIPGELDTLTVLIFKQLFQANNPGYAAALAFILFGAILVLTITQNELAKDRVFYG